MKNVFIVTTRVLAFREALGVVRDTEKGQPGFMVAWGEAGRGKSECAKEYAINHEDVTYIRVYEQWTARAMLATICRNLNGMNPGMVDRAKRIIIEELDQRPRTLLIDEADRLDIRLVEHLRDIHDETGCPVVLIGEPTLYAQLKARSRIWQRVTRVVNFGPVIVDDVVLFGLKACGIKVDAQAANVLLKRCHGSFRLLYHDMVDLERVAKANETGDVSMDLVGMLPDRRLAPERSK